MTFLVLMWGLKVEVDEEVPNKTNQSVEWTNEVSPGLEGEISS
jgi:hypothetical protein